MKVKWITILAVLLIIIIIIFIFVNFNKGNSQETISIMNSSDFTIENGKDTELYRLSLIDVINSDNGPKYVATTGKTLEEIDSYSKEIETITKYCPELFNEKKYNFYSDYFMIVDVQYDGDTANWIMEDIYGNKIISKNENTINDDKDGYRERFLCKIYKIVFRPIDYKKLEWVARTDALDTSEIIEYDKTLTEDDFNKIKQKYNIKEYDYRMDLDISERKEKEEKALNYLKEKYGEEAEFEIRDVYQSNLFSNSTYIYNIYSKDIDSEFEYIDYGDRVNEDFLSSYLEKKYNIKSISDFTEYEENKINNKLKELSPKWSISLLDLTGSFEQKNYGHLPEPEEVYTRNNTFINIDNIYYNANEVPQVIKNNSSDNRNLSLEELQDILIELKNNNINEVIKYLINDFSINEEDINIRYNFINNEEEDYIEFYLSNEVTVRHYGTPFLSGYFPRNEFFINLE